MRTGKPSQRHSAGWCTGGGYYAGSSLNEDNFGGPFDKGAVLFSLDRQLEFMHNIYRLYTVPVVHGKPYTLNPTKVREI